MNTLRAVVDHALAEAEELESSAKVKIAEAGEEMQRAAALRQVYEVASQWEKPGTLHREKENV